MNDAPQCVKRCYRCPAVVRMSAEEFRASPNEFGICPVCRAKLDLEAGFAGQAISETTTSPLSPAGDPGFVPGSRTGQCETEAKTPPSAAYEI